MPEMWYLNEIRHKDKELRDLKKQNERKDERIAELERENERMKEELKQYALAKQAKKPRFSQNFSLSHHEQKKKEKQPSPGRTPKADKLSTVQREESVYPDGVSPGDCVLSHTRIVTHIRKGQKEVVLYSIYKKKWCNETPDVPGVLPRGEYGLEVAVTLAFLVYVIEISIKQAQDILLFFTGIELSDAQANRLLSQLETVWNPEFEKLITLVTLACLVHIDETGWKTGKERNYAWIFQTLAHTVFFYGKSRGEDTLETILSREFPGTVITDFLSTYEKYFKSNQKCWAHVLRTVIKLMLQNPKKRQYRRFFDDLYALFTEGKAARMNEHLTEAERIKNVAVFQKRLCMLCTRSDERLSKNTPDDVREFVNLQKRLRKYQDQMFTFVLHPEVEPTNNRAEQGLRKTAKARNNYQTSKTKAGADRRSVLSSVLTSLQQNLPSFSLTTVIEEVTKWRREGSTLFDRQLQTAQARASPG